MGPVHSQRPTQTNRATESITFDFITFLSNRGISYVTAGPNLPRSDICAIRCPWCTDDPSQHLSISPKGWYLCRRNRSHKGKNPARLVQALIGCSAETARAITGQDHTNIPENSMARVRERLRPPAPPIKRILKMPAEFRKFRDVPSARPFIAYLERRGFGHDTILNLTDNWDIRYAVTGPFHHRIVFPIIVNGDLVTWTARTISADNPVRYKTMTTDPERAQQLGLKPASRPINDYLLWQDHLAYGGGTIVLCEGPFVCLKINVVGMRHGIVSTCFFTNSPSNAQIDILHEVLPKFRRRILLLDQGTLSISLRVTATLREFSVHLGRLPDNVKDPGDLSERELMDIIAKVP